MATSLSSCTCSSCILIANFQREKGLEMQVLYYNCCWWLFWKCSISLFPPTLACYWNAPSSERDYIAAVTGCRGPSRNFGRTWSLVPFFRTVAAATVMTRLRSSYHMAIHIIIHFFFHLSFFPPCAVPTLLNGAKSQKGKKGKKRAVREMCIIKEERSVATVAHKALGSRSSLLCGIFVLSLGRV